MKWIAFFSQTGSEIANISRQIKRWPDLVVTNKQDNKNLNIDLLYHYREGTAVSGTQELARLAGVGTGATSVTQTVTSIHSTGAGGIIGSVAFNTTGLTGTSGNTSSTNSKIGYNYYASFLGECIPSGANLVRVYRHGFNITPVGKRVRTINFYTAIKSILFTNQDECC